MWKDLVDTESRVAAFFNQKFGFECAGIARAPGRVNLLGEHVDYNGGFVLPAAIDRATYVAFSPIDTNEYDVWAMDYGEEAIFSSQTLEAKSRLEGGRLPDWALYPAGVARTLLQSGYGVGGLKAVLGSDVPQGAGLSSSASVELAFATAWKSLGAWSAAPMELAVLCQRAENTYVGVNCGIMDQAASACGEESKLLLLDCRSLEYELLPLPAGAAIVIADTGIRHALAVSAYNARRAACEDAVRILGRYLPNVAALRDVSPADFNRLASKLPREVELRARHVVEEIERTRQAVPLLRAGDVRGFGALMNACHASLRDLYEVSCPELDIMAKIAQSLKGCYGARLTGAGFGGCTVNLVAREYSDSFAEALFAGYMSETQRRPEIYVCRASAGSGIIYLASIE
jgi:galactokinase